MGGWGGGQGGCERNVGGRGDVGYGGLSKSRRYCTRYKKALYNIKKIKKNVGGETEGQYLNQKHSLCIQKRKRRKKKKKKKKIDRAGI